MKLRQLATGWLLCIAALISVAPPVYAANPVSQVKDKMCPDVNFGKQLQSICWDCFFPFTIFGIPVGGSSSRLPNDRASSICLCPGRTGYPAIGFTLGWWAPDHIIESVRIPYCMPSLGGTVLADDELKGSDIGASGSSNLLPARWGGTDKKKNSDAALDSTFYNFHYIKFPVAYFIGWLSDFACSKGKSSAVDIAFMSEFDPSWNNDELALWTSPETKLFTGMWAALACAADGVASTVNKPIQNMFFCAGTWGGVYPFSGNTPTGQSGPRDAALGATKGVAKMHRYSIAQKTYGNSALCSNQMYFVLPKQQYRFQQIFPMPEKKNHWIGASSYRWGEWRTIPATGEDYIQVKWSYNECCVTVW